MNRIFIRVAFVVAGCSSLVSAGLASDVQVTFNLTGTNAPTGLYDTYLSFYEGSQGQGGAWDGPFSPQNGQVISVTNPGMFGSTAYDFAMIGLYNDANGGVHVAIGSANDLSGQSWDSLFPGFTESSIITNLESSNPNVAAIMLAESKEGFLGTPIQTTSSGTASITGFSNGENIGTMFSQAAPEPSPLLVLGLLPLTFLRRRKGR